MASTCCQHPRRRRFGPTWHQAAQREKRQLSFEDFASVARHLIETGVTSPRHLGIQGGSNGGLLVSAVMVQWPGTVQRGRVPGAADRHAAVPPDAGRRVVVAEFGNRRTRADWAFLEKYSPYHNVHADRRYPAVLFTTSTRDDRVHPRTRARWPRMIEQGHEVLLREHRGRPTAAQPTTPSEPDLVALSTSSSGASRGNGVGKSSLKGVRHLFGMSDTRGTSPPSVIISSAPKRPRSGPWMMAGCGFSLGGDHAARSWGSGSRRTHELRPGIDSVAAPDPHPTISHARLQFRFPPPPDRRHRLSAFDTPFGRRLMVVYCDLHGLGPLPGVRRALQTLRRIYANTHTGTTLTGRSMSRLLHQAEAPMKPRSTRS